MISKVWQGQIPEMKLGKMKHEARKVKSKTQGCWRRQETDQEKRLGVL